MKRHFPVIVEQDIDGVLVVECPLFKGCRSYGRTIDEAMNNIQEAIEACLEDETVMLDFPTFIGVRDLEVQVNE